MTAARREVVASLEEARRRQRKIGGETVEPTGGDGDNGDMEARVAVLEQIAKSTEATLREIKGDLRGFEAEAKGRQLTLLIAVVGTGIAVAGVLLAAQSNMLSAFQAGLSAVQTAVSARPEAPAAPIVIQIPPPPPAALPPQPAPPPG